MPTGSARRTVTVIYKICPVPLWKAAERTGVFRGSEVDRRDGFIHFSSAEIQDVETAEKHFVGQNGLLLVNIGVAQNSWYPS